MTLRPVRALGGVAWLSFEPLAEFEINQETKSPTGVGGSFRARPWEAEIGVWVAGPEGPAYVFEKSRADMARTLQPRGDLRVGAAYAPSAVTV